MPLCDHLVGLASRRVTSHTLRSSVSVLTLNPNSRHIFSMTAFSWRIWPSMRLRPLDFAYSMISCIRAPALEVRSQQDRVLAGHADRAGVEPDDAERHDWLHRVRQRPSRAHNPAASAWR